MVATVRSREFDVDRQPCQTEQLVNWISKIRSKKVIARKSRKRDLRVEAVLTSVLSKAEQELRIKQVARIMKWQQMKQRLLEDIACKKESYKNGDCQDGGLHAQKQSNAWSDPLCPELSSLDSFMSQLNEIKMPLHR